MRFFSQPRMDVRRQTKRFVGLAATAVLLFGLCATAALAQVDCDKLRSTNIPYQLSFDISPGLVILRDTSQVFRQPDNVEIAYKFNSSTPGVVLKQIGHYGLIVKLMSILPGNAIDIDYLYDTDLAQISLLGKKDTTYQLTARHSGKDVIQHTKTTFLKEDTMVVGACSFHTLNYHIETGADNAPHSSATIVDIAWSPDLRTTLSSRGAIGGPNKETATPYFFTATAITTDFQQISDK